MSNWLWGGTGWGGWAAVGRMRRALLLLALATSCAALVLYWRQQTDDALHRHDRSHLLRYVGTEPQWTWTCRGERCERAMAEPEQPMQSLATCNMLCASTQLWPQPTGPVSLATAGVPVSADHFNLQIVAAPSNEVNKHLRLAFDFFKVNLKTLERSTGNALPLNTGKFILVRIAVNGSVSTQLRLDTDESYEISLKPTESALVADIAARSYCGARHALETLSQLVWLDPYAGGGSLMMLEAATISDAPKFSYRALLLDTARNFFPVSDILRTLDAMAANKLNTFHWHATDSQSFPLMLASVPKLAEHGAYSPEQVYTTDDIKEIVRYARVRGIRVVIEVDAPSHVGRAWSWGTEAGMGELAQCVEMEPWSMVCGEPPCGQLNPKNENVYDILEKIYDEIIVLTGVDDVFHLGGDEVSETCWRMNFNESEPMELWHEFTKKALARLVKVNKGQIPQLTMLWSSRLTQSPYLEMLDRHLAIQVWGSSQWPESTGVIESGYKAVISHVDAWYLDCGFGSWRDSSDGHCGPYRNWQKMYEHRPWMELGGAKSQVVGAAVCQWSEQLGPEGLDTRLWPRSAAFAERLWSDCPQGAVKDVYLRIDTQRARMIARGIRAGAIWPEWCTQNPSACLPP